MRLKMLGWLPLLSLAANAQAQQAPWGRPNVPISRQDRVYAADQTSNTVSVIDPVGNRLLGVIRLGDPVPGALSPLYRGELLVHGLGYSPDGKTIVFVSDRDGNENLWLHDVAWWHIELVPRLSVLAGLELGAGIYVNTLDPAEAARQLREAVT